MQHRFYQMPTLAGVWVFVLENKVLAGREPRHASDAQSRPLVVAFFERAPGSADELVVKRRDADFSGMSTKVLTPAELALHLGYMLPPDADRTPREIEDQVEQAWLGLERVTFTHELLTDADEPHMYQLREPTDAEDVFWNSQPITEHTKYSISRHLEKMHGWDRVRLWNCTVPELRASVATGVAPWDVVPPAPMAPAAGRGRGRGRAAAGPGRARGRARGRGRV